MDARKLAPALVAVLLFAAVGYLLETSNSEMILYLPAAGKKVWQKLVPEFEKEYHVKAKVIYGSSGKLLAQAYLSKRGDVLGSATPPYMKKAESYGIVYNDTVTFVACMQPAILVPKGSNVSSLKDLLKPGIKVAMCNTESCAVGKFIKYMLEKMGLWDKVKKHIVVYTENFAKLVAVLRLKEVDAALGWSVAAKWYPDSIEAHVISGPEPYKPCIVLAVLKSSKSPKLAEEFIKFVTSQKAVELWKAYGYVPAR